MKHKNVKEAHMSFENISNHVKAYIYDKVTSPLITTFVISWMAINYRLFMVLYPSDESLKVKFDHIDNDLYPHWGVPESCDSFFTLSNWGSVAHIAILPIVSTLFIIYLVPHFSKHVLIYTMERRKDAKKKYQDIHDIIAVDPDEHSLVKKENREKEAKFELERVDFIKKNKIKDEVHDKLIIKNEKLNNDYENLYQELKTLDKDKQKIEQDLKESHGNSKKQKDHIQSLVEDVAKVEDKNDGLLNAKYKYENDINMTLLSGNEYELVNTIFKQTGDGINATVLQDIDNYLKSKNIKIPQRLLITMLKDLEVKELIRSVGDSTQLVELVRYALTRSGYHSLLKSSLLPLPSSSLAGYDSDEEFVLDAMLGMGATREGKRIPRKKIEEKSYNKNFTKKRFAHAIDSLVEKKCIEIDDNHGEETYMALPNGVNEMKKLE